MSAGLRALAEEQLATLRIEAEIDSIEAIRRLLLAGRGATLMPASTFHADIEARRLAAHPVEDANLHRIVVLARPAGDAPAGAPGAIERVVRAEVTGLEQAGIFKLPARKRVTRS
jgi:LysR family nitrogen assimilation transcriptional regulator